MTWTADALSYAIWLTRNVLGGLAVLAMLLIAAVMWWARERR